MVSKVTHLGKIAVVALTFVIIVAGEMNYPLWRGQDLPYGGEMVIAGEINHPLRRGQDLPHVGETVVGIRDFFVLREVGRVSGREELANSWGCLKPTIIHRRQHTYRRQIEMSGRAEQ